VIIVALMSIVGIKIVVVGDQKDYGEMRRADLS
jgi:hypothetical protein